ncbi:MAG: beta-glucosidase, partial [Sphingobacteriaceae bacterium]
PVPTTIFPQAIGLAETWDPALLQKAAAIEGHETRYLFQSEKYHKGGLVVRAPNADLGRDPRWGRTEECYGEDAFFNGTMAVAYIKGLQGNDPKYWLTSALMKHFLANSNERSRDSSSSDFDERLWREYYSVPFRMGVLGGSRAYMASYNSVNGIPQAVNPSLKNITVKEWGQNGIICTDGGAYKMLLTAHHYFKTPEEAAAACIKAGINQFLDNYLLGVKTALEKRLLKEAEIDQVLRGVFRVMIKLGQLDPAEMVAYSKIKDGPEPWLSAENKAFARLITQKSVVLLKNDKQLLPLNKSTLKSIAVVGPRSAEVLQDWYSGSPSYSVSPLEGIKNKLGANVTVMNTTNDDLAVSMAKSAEVALVCIGNHPTGNGGWKQVSSPSEGKEAVDREEISLDSTQEKLIQKVYAANPKTIVVLISSFPYAINWAQANIPAILHITHCSQELGNALADAV